MGMKISNLDIIKLLPIFMRDDEAVQAFSKAINKLLSAQLGDINRLREWDKVDALTSEELDEIAWEMDLEWYDKTVSIENKRATIKAATLLKEKAGTKWAVVEAVKAIYGVEPIIDEWFDYSGEPGHFKCKIEAARGFNFEKVMQAINFVKRASAHIDSIEMYADERLDLYIGFASCAFKEYETAMSADDVDVVDYLVDELGNTLVNELGDVLIV